jgi:hypothetical protein
MTALDIATELVETPFESTRIEAAEMLRKQDAAIKQLREALMACKAAGFIAESKAKEALEATEYYK